MLIKFVCVLLCMEVVVGYLFNDPCDVFPTFPHSGIPESDVVMDTSVPASCKNGTFRWDYPRGHVMLHFQNPHQVPTSICIRDGIGGDVFTITDKANNKQIATFTEKIWACTDATKNREIVLQVDAPEELRYMGEVEYKITH